MAVFLLVWAAALALAYRATDTEVQQPIIRGLEYDAHIILTALQAVAAVGGDQQFISRLRSEAPSSIDVRVYQIWRGENILFSSIKDNNFPPPKKEGAYGFRDTIDRTDQPWYNHDTYWYIYSLYEPTLDIWVIVAQDTAPIQRILRLILIRSYWPLIIILLGAGVLTWVAVTFGLRPLSILTANLSSRGAEDFQHIYLDNNPRELQPVIQSLNSLFSRLEKTFERERQFSQNAAHEIRGPLAAIETQLYNVAQAVKETQAQHAVVSLKKRVRRLACVVDNLLQLARLDAPLIGGLCAIDLNGVISDVLADFSDLIKERNLTIDHSNSTDHVLAHKAVIVIAFKNLIDNAVRYSPVGGSILIISERSGDSVSVCFKNAAPELDGSDVSRLSERFFRPVGSTGLGSGLGLSIALRIAEIYDGSVALNLEDEQLSVCFRIYDRRV